MPEILLASEAATEGPTPLGPKDYWTMGIKIFNFAILIYILVRFLAKPLSDYLTARAEAVRSRVAALTDKKEAARRSEAEYRDKLRSIEDEIVRLKETARRDMEQEKQRSLDEARLAAEEILRHANDTVQRELIKARNDLHREAARLSLELAEELIRKQLDAKDQQRFAEEYIRNIERHS